MLILEYTTIVTKHLSRNSQPKNLTEIVIWKACNFLELQSSTSELGPQITVPYEQQIYENKVVGINITGRITCCALPGDISYERKLNTENLEH